MFLQALQQMEHRKITSMIKKEIKMEYRSPVNNSLSRGPVYGNGKIGWQGHKNVWFMIEPISNWQQILQKIYSQSLL